MKNNNLYNDKELFDDADLDWYDYGYRNYDPQIGRFTQLDPLTDDYPELTNYQYASDEPIANVDMDGLEKASSIVDFTYNFASKSDLVLRHASQVSTELTKTASHIVPIAIQGIHLAVNIVQNEINNHSLNKNADADVSKSVMDYYLAHKNEMSFTDFLALNSLANNYYKGLNCMAWWAKGDFLKLNRAIINSTLPDELKVQLVELGIEDSQEGRYSYFHSAANTALFISSLGLFPEVGMGPKGSTLKFRTLPQAARGGFSNFSNLDELAGLFQGKNLSNTEVDLLKNGWKKLEGDWGSKTIFSRQVGKERFFATWESANMEHSTNNLPTSYWKITKGKISAYGNNVRRISDAANFAR